MISKKLSNGLQLLMSPLTETKAVTVLVLLPAGSRYESDDINGVSHFVEHLIFKGTKKRPTSLDITRELDSVGAEFNAFTSKDHTGYYIKAAADKIELAFDVLSDMIFNSKFEEKEINKERGVIIEEINMYEDNPMMYVSDVLEQTVFKDHKLGQQIAGPRKVIASVPRSKLVAYKNKFYKPSNMVVSVAGNFTAAKAQALAKKYFNNDGKNSKAPAFVKFKSTQTKPRVKLVYKDSEQVQMALGLPAYKMGDPKMYPLYLLSVILGGNMSSRLFMTVREEHGLAYFVRSSIQGYQDTGLFYIQSGLDKKRIKKALELILNELKNLKDEDVSVQELKNAQEYLKGKLILDLEDSEHVANWYGTQKLLLDTSATPEDRIKKIMAVTVKQVREAAQDVFDLEKISLAMIGPFKDKAIFEKLLKY